jgi:hypothetical protein
MGVQLDWDFDNFVIHREALTNPSAPTTSLLQGLERRQAALSSEINAHRQDIEGQSDNFANRVLRLEDTRRFHEEGAVLNSRLRELKNILALRPATRKVLDQLLVGREKEAISAIESSSADPLTVLKEYSLVQLDLMNYSAVDGLSTPATLPAVISVSRAGLAFQKARLPNEASIAASMLHNLASAAAPESGSVTPEQQQIGRDAATEALALRQQLGNVHDIGVAEYMVGVYQYHDKKFADAEKTFSSSRAKLSSTPPNEAYAWATLFLGYTQLDSGKPQGQALVDEARSVFAQIGSSYGQRYVKAGLGKN